MPHPIDVEVGRRIRRRRMQHKMTQSELAKKLGISFQQVQKYETAKNRISISRLCMIANALPVTTVWQLIPHENEEWR